MLGESLELLVEIGRLEARRRLLSQQAISKSVFQMTRLERSLASRQPKMSGHIETRHVGDFLRVMTQNLEKFIDESVDEYPKANEV